MAAILGISQSGWESAAAMVVDGSVVATSVAGSMAAAVRRCLEKAGLTAERIDRVGIAFRRDETLWAVVERAIRSAPRGFAAFLREIRSWAERRTLKDVVPGRPIEFVAHDEAQAAGAFFQSPFDAAAIVTGEALGVGRGNSITLTHQQRSPGALHQLYAAIALFAHFPAHGNLMKLAPHGQPKYADVMREKVIDLRADGSFVLKTAQFDEIFGGPPRRANEPVGQREMDLAASLQSVAEEISTRSARFAREQAGGTANVVIANEMSAVAAASGAGLFVWHQVLGNSRTANLNIKSPILEPQRVA